MDFRHKDTPVQVFSVGLQVTLYITTLAGFLGMISASRSENAYVLLILITRLVILTCLAAERLSFVMSLYLLFR